MKKLPFAEKFPVEMPKFKLNITTCSLDPPPLCQKQFRFPYNEETLTNLSSVVTAF